VNSSGKSYVVLLPVAVFALGWNIVRIAPPSAPPARTQHHSQGIKGAFQPTGPRLGSNLKSLSLSGRVNLLVAVGSCRSCSMAKLPLSVLAKVSTKGVHVRLVEFSFGNNALNRVASPIKIGDVLQCNAGDFDLLNAAFLPRCYLVDENGILVRSQQFEQTIEEFLRDR